MKAWMNFGRAALARWWGIFVLLWCGVVVVFGFPINHLVCNAENSGPADGSARASYCAGISDFMSSGEPSEWTTPLPFLLPIALLAAVGSYGIWRRSKHLLSRAAIVAVAALLGHVIVLAVLPG
jgi:hypothetical protein